MNDARQNDNVQFGYHLVAFIDVLGQRDILRTLTALPSSNDDYAAFVRTIKESFGVIDGIRKLHESFFEGMEHTPSYWEELSEDQRKAFLYFQRSSLRTIWFSDTVLMYTPLQTTETHLPLNSIYQTLMWAGTIMLLSLAAGRPVRGGIDIGIGAEMYPGEIYGQCLVSAYDLESKVAEYPRIVVGGNTLDYLNSFSSPTTSSKLAQYEMKLARTCLRLIAKDSDGHNIIDYAGEHFQSLIGNHPSEPDPIPNALAFVSAQLNRYQSDGNTKLLERYRRLFDYLQRRSEAVTPVKHPKA